MSEDAIIQNPNQLGGPLSGRHPARSAIFEQSLRAVPPAERITWLANELAMTQDAAFEELAAYVYMTAMRRDQVVNVQPDFNLAPFAECQRRGCLLGRVGAGMANDVADPNTMLFVCQDPADLHNHQWFEPLIESAAPARLLRVLVRQQDFSDLLQSAELALRAMDTVRIDDVQADPMEAGSVLILSMASIESTSNPTVRLLDSTLYDALKLGASDIHFEVQQRADQVPARRSVAGHQAGGERGNGHADHLAHQGPGRPRHRGAPDASGWAFQGSAESAGNRFPGVGHAQHLG
jgi:hypothetical protein